MTPATAEAEVRVVVATNSPQPDSSPSACRCPWPAPAIYRIAGRTETVTILGLTSHGEVRVIREDGSIGRVAESRVVLRLP